MGEKIIPPGTKIITQGQTGCMFYLITKGSFIWDKKLSGSDVIKSFYFGELSVLNHTFCMATVVSKTEGRLLCIRKETFISIFLPLKNYFTSQNPILYTPNYEPYLEKTLDPGELKLIQPQTAHHIAYLEYHESSNSSVALMRSNHDNKCIAVT